jgi:hypothetical protein
VGYPRYSDFLPAALAFAHLALAAALILALAAALILDFFFGAGFTDKVFPFTFAHLALAAALILALDAALIVRFFFGAGLAANLTADGLAVEPNNRLNSFSKAAIFSLRLAA